MACYVRRVQAGRQAAQKGVLYATAKDFRKHLAFFYQSLQLQSQQQQQQRQQRIVRGCCPGNLKLNRQKTIAKTLPTSNSKKKTHTHQNTHTYTLYVEWEIFRLIFTALRA